MIGNSLLGLTWLKFPYRTPSICAYMAPRGMASNCSPLQNIPKKTVPFTSFESFVKWRKERDLTSKKRRNKSLMDFMQTRIPAQFQLADLSTVTRRKDKDRGRVIKEAGWESTGLGDTIIEAMQAMNFEKPTEIQSLTVKELLKKESVVLCASETGSGKTLAYLLPIVEKLKREEKDSIACRKLRAPRAIVLVPSHELVLQTYRVAKQLSHYTKLRVQMLSRDLDSKEIARMLANPVDIVISTPGQVVTAYHEGVFTEPKSLKHLVVDEADTLLVADFGEDVRKTLDIFTRPVETIVVVTATVPQSLNRALDRIFPDISRLTTKGLHQPTELVRQRFIDIKTPGDAKKQECLKLLQTYSGSRTLIFCNTSGSAFYLHKFLTESLIRIDDGANSKTQATTFLNRPEGLSKISLPSLLHGKLPEKQREAIMAAFLAGDIRTLVCTDLASRGLDTTFVNHVIMYDFPMNVIDYLHRIGRTARAGRGGRMTAFTTNKDRRLAAFIQLAIQQHKPFSHALPV